LKLFFSICYVYLLLYVYMGNFTNWVLKVKLGKGWSWIESICDICIFAIIRWREGIIFECMLSLETYLEISLKT